MRIAFFAGGSLLLALVPFPAFDQSVEETAAGAAEQSGKYQVALQQYTAALGKVQDGNADDQRLREAIIRIVVRVTPKPAISPEARRFFVRGQTAFKDAKSPADMEEAAKEFGRAARVAPWWPDAYMNQGIAYAEAGKLADAMRSLKLYLVAAPNAPDAQKVIDRISALEYRLERSQKEAISRNQEEERKRSEEDAKARDPARLAGAWCPIAWLRDGGCGLPMELKINGSNFEIWTDLYSSAPNPANFRLPPVDRIWYGTVAGDNLQGKFRMFVSTKCSSYAESVMEGKVTSGGTQIDITFELFNPPQSNCQYHSSRRESVRLVRVQRQ